MLKKVYLRNYKSIGEVEVELGQFTAFIGPNASGKSNLIDALRFVRDAVTAGLDNAISNPRRGIKAIRRWSKGSPYDVTIKLTLHSPSLGTETEYSFVLGSEKGGEYRVKIEACATHRADGTHDGFKIQNGKIIQAPRGFQSGLDQPQPIRTLLFPLWGFFVAPEAVNFIRAMGFYNPAPLTIRASTQWPMKVAYPLTEYGENLPFVLWTLQKDHPSAFQEICSTLENLVPGIKALTVPSNSRVSLEHGDGDASRSRLDLWQESDGTLRILALLTALYQQPPLPLLAIEEPELTVHPSALAMLVDLLISQSAIQQTIITTHSPDLLSRLPAETLRIVEFVGGETKIGLLAEDQREAIAEKYFKLGDLLRIEGLRRELPEPIETR